VCLELAIQVQLCLFLMLLMNKLIFQSKDFLLIGAQIFWNHLIAKAILMISYMQLNFSMEWLSYSQPLYLFPSLYNFYHLALPTKLHIG
jgi:hypothetical protein